MKNIYSNIFKFNRNILKKTARYLKKKHLVALPTETVYGLAGNAYSDKSVAKIFRLKNRPKFNPLIIHYYDLKRAEKDVFINDELIKLYKKLSPGPITFVVSKKKNSKLSSIATANLKTVAIRFPSNKIIRRLLKELTFPLAIPSANKSGRLSPVDSIDVVEEFNNKIKIIIDGGRSKFGVESTVVNLTENFSILRYGAISKNIISKILKKKYSTLRGSKKILSPGNLKKHYSPGIPLILNQKKNIKGQAFLVFGKKYKNSKHTFNLSKKSNLKQAAQNLYKTLRKIKKLNYKRIYVAKIPNTGIGEAINDRLKRAAN